MQFGIASALAAGILAATSIADARTTKIEILTRAIAFGGYSFDGVGQYEKITGIATGEVNPDDPKNAVIVDIRLAPKLPNGNVQYRHNFYILKPVDLSKGNHKMMYEPPNRGGKTYAHAQPQPRRKRPGPRSPIPPRSPTRSCGPAATRRCGAAGRMTLGSLTGLTATAELPIAHESGRRDDHRPRVRVHRDRGRARSGWRTPPRR